MDVVTFDVVMGIVVLVPLVTVEGVCKRPSAS
jgi:hypothetical protein